jgi:hypothetical protein
MARHEEIALRIELLMGLKAQGYTYTQLVQAAMKQWHVSERHAKRYLREVKKLENQLASESSSEFVGRWRSKNHYLYTKAIQDSNLELARRALADEARTFKAFNQGGKANGSVGDSTQASQEELGSLLAKLAEKWPG